MIDDGEQAEEAARGEMSVPAATAASAAPTMPARLKTAKNEPIRLRR